MSPSPPSSLDQATSFKGYSFNCLALNPAASMQVAATTASSSCAEIIESGKRAA
jgi:hypothetical protein